MVTYIRIRRRNLKLSSAGTPSVRRRLSPTSESHPIVMQRALQRATWHLVGTWRFSRLCIASRLVTRLLHFSVSFPPTPRDSVQGGSPRAEDKLENWMESLEDIPCGCAAERSTRLNAEAAV